MTLTQKTIIESIKSLNNPLIQIVEDGSILMEDILKEINLNDFNLEGDLNIYEHLKVIAICETSPLLKDKYFESDIIYLYILIDNNNLSNIYIGIDYLHPLLWINIKINSNDDFKNKLEKIINIYCTDIFYDHEDCEIKFEKKVRGFIGTEKMLNMQIKDFENFIVGNRFCEYFIWGSYWSDFPYRQQILNDKLQNFELERMMAHSLKQRNNVISLSTRTKASKSIVTFEHVKGAIIIEIKYNKYNNDSINIYNELTENYLPDDLPLDVIGAINQFAFINYKNLLNVRPFTIHNVNLSLELINKNEELEYIIVELKNIENNNELSKEIINYSKETRIILEINKKINEIENIKDKILEFIKLDEFTIQESIDNAKNNLLEWLYNKINIDDKIIENEEFVKNHIKNICDQLIYNMMETLNIN